MNEHKRLLNALVGKKAITLFSAATGKNVSPLVVILWISLKRIRVMLKWKKINQKKWNSNGEDYHQEQLAEHQFDDEDDDWDDWDEEDEEGVEFIYKP